VGRRQQSRVIQSADDVRRHGTGVPAALCERIARERMKIPCDRRPDALIHMLWIEWQEAVNNWAIAVEFDVRTGNGG
jgi:hypothetical protein